MNGSLIFLALFSSLLIDISLWLMEASFFLSFSCFTANGRHE